MVDNRFELINEDKELVSLCLASQYSREVNLYMDGELHFINVMGSQVGSSNVVNERLENNRGPNIGIDDIEANLVDVRVGGVEVDLVEGSEDSDSDYNVYANDEQIHGDDDGLFMENIDPDVEWRGDGANVTITESEESDDSGSDCGEVDLAESEDDLQSLGGNFSGDEGDNAVGNTTFNPNHFFDPNKMRETWEWFLRLLKEDLQIVRDYEYTLISDKQKGLIPAVETVMLQLNTGFVLDTCTTTLKNAGFRGQALKFALWKAAKATTVQDFTRRMEELATLDEKAAAWFHDKSPTHWSRSHFPKSDMLLNNLCETFNCNILDARAKPVLTLLEWIREYLMIRKWDLTGIPCKHALCAILCDNGNPEEDETNPPVNLIPDEQPLAKDRVETARTYTQSCYSLNAWMML
ncbi:UNVERIFIED_CONTAM: hypothetical protein Scaly_1504700 [Sesamum calycinum]|uniref:Zinc finger PMZ-type domain-containing protein n=1 Tax=Sesamum calycinum TaxID=2727403 RepID=A0AAW2PPU8_9LAMI